MEGKWKKVMTGNMILQRIRLAAAKIGEAALGYPPSAYGTHSVRSGTAMALILSRHDTWHIHLTGR